MKTIRELVLRDRLVFIRCDFNVPFDDEGNISDDARIKATLSTIEYAVQQGARVVLGSHMGRPKGKVVPELSLQPVANRLHELLGQDIHFVPDCIGDEAKKRKKELKRGEILLLENLRFYESETKNDLHFAEQLAEGIDVFVQEAFGALHRAHASTTGLPSLVFDKGIGFLVESELEALDKIVGNPKQPFVVVVGGSKVSDKVDVIKNLAPHADIVLTGGGVANAFAKGLGHDVAGSLVESDSVGKGQEGVDFAQVAAGIYKEFESKTPDIKIDGMGELSTIQLPLDFVAAASMDAGAETKIVELGGDVPEGWMFLDVGPKTQQLYKQILEQAKTIFWNGPLGVFEMDAYAEGSRVVAQAVADSEGYAVLGGGDTEVVTQKFGLKGQYSHASTGGGASLTYLAEKPMPGLEALD